MMRISTSNFYSTAIGKITDLQGSLAKTQEQLSTNRRLLTPSDDPVAASRALEISQSQAVNTALTTNRQNARDSLNLASGTLGSVTLLLQHVKSEVVQAGNAGLADSDRSAIATSLSSELDQLVGLANTQDATGQYLFSGYSTTTQPFTKTATGAAYNGDQGQRLLQVGQQRQIAVSDTGQNIFQSDTGAPEDIFKTMTDLITALQTPGGAGLSDALATANDNIDAALDNVSMVNTAFGSSLQELDSLDSAGSDLDVQYQASLSSLQDLDYAKAVSDLTQQQITLQAAQQSFVKISGLSLFNFLS